MIDALMDMPGTQFGKSLLAKKAGASRQSMHTQIPLLVNLGIVTEVDESDPVEYTLNDDEIVQLLHRLEGVVNRRLNPKTKTEMDELDPVARIVWKFQRSGEDTISITIT